MKLRGLSLAELALYLAIAAVLVAVVISVGYGLLGKSKTQAAADSIERLRSMAAACWLAGGRVSYSGISVQALKDENCLPQGFSGSGSNPWGGNYVVEPDPTDVSRLRITVTQVPPKDGETLVRIFQKKTDVVSYDSGSRTFVVVF